MILFTHPLFCTEFWLQMHRIMESIANNEQHFIAFLPYENAQLNLQRVLQFSPLI